MQRVFFVFNELILHQIRIIQYYRLFKRFDGLNMLNENDRKWFNEHEEDIKKALSLHDSDKLKNETVVEAYLVQEYIRSFIKTPDGKKFLKENPEINEKMINKLAAVLRRSHSDVSKHHNEYYIYHKGLPDINTAFEFIFDIMAIGDKRNEKIGEYYKEKHETSFGHFGNHHELIEKVFNFFKDQEHFKIIEERKKELEKSVLNEKIEEKQTKIAEDIEKVVWQPIDDRYEKNIEILKVVSENMLYKATEEWQQKNQKGTYEIMGKIAKIKEQTFNLSELEKKMDELYSSQGIDLAGKTIDGKIKEIEQKNESHEKHKLFFAVHEGKKHLLEKHTEGDARTRL